MRQCRPVGLCSPQRRGFWPARLGYIALLLALLWSATLDALTLDNVRARGDVIMGTYYDYALLPDTLGREQQVQVMRAVLGVEVDISPRWQFLGEYNFANTEIYRDDDNRARHDWYRNLGVDTVYYGNSQLREAYFAVDIPSGAVPGQWRSQIGRQFTLVGFHPDELPYWSRIDAPHSQFLSNGLFTGIRLSGHFGGFQSDAFYFMGQDHPDRSYNYYGIETDPQIKTNASPGGALRLMSDHRWAESVHLKTHVSAHVDKIGSATGSLQRGKHNDYRFGAGARLTLPTPRWTPLTSITLDVQARRFRTGLTSDGEQGEADLEDAYNIYRNGYYGSVISRRYNWSLRVTHEQLDRADSQVFGMVAELDPSHPSMDTVERSLIVDLGYALTDGLDWHLVYRQLDNPFPEISGIGEYRGKHRGEDKWLSYIRWRF